MLLRSPLILGIISGLKIFAVNFSPRLTIGIRHPEAVNRKGMERKRRRRLKRLEEWHVKAQLLLEYWRHEVMIAFSCLYSILIGLDLVVTIYQYVIFPTQAKQRRIASSPTLSKLGVSLRKVSRCGRRNASSDGRKVSVG